MSILFGFYFPQGYSSTLKQHVQEAEDYWSSLNGPCKNYHMTNKLAIFQVDYLQYEQPAWIKSKTQVSSLVGHPLITKDRFDDLNYLTVESDFRVNRFKQAEGAYCLSHFNCSTQQLTLVTDPLGLRPFYYLFFEGGIIFSSCLTFFKQLSLQLTANEEGLCEFATLGYYLLDHSPYHEVKCARPGQALTFAQDGESTLLKYFDWLSLNTSYRGKAKAINSIDRDFKQVCEKYAGQDNNVLTTLSGGLDSRLIACELQRQNKNITAFNFSQNETQDLFCARAFAQQNEINLKEVRVADTQEFSIEQRLGLHWRQKKPQEYEHVCRPQLAWSGNGGSVGLGYIYCSEKLYQAALTQDVELLADAYIEQQFAYLPSSVLAKAQHHQTKLRENIIKSIGEFSQLPLEKAYYLFLLHNDQHHHLAIPYEDINSYQMEFCLPMYSWRVLRHIISLPVEEVRRHKFYLSWLEKCYPEALQQPWQAYPGHIKCHLETKGTKQWQIVRKNRFTARQILQVWKGTFGRKEHALVNKSRLTVLCLLHLLGLKDVTWQAKLVFRLNNLLS